MARSVADAPDPAVPRRILPVIVLSQFAGTSLWFAVNAVMPDLQAQWALPAAAVGSLTSAVQLGFVAGTLVFAIAMVADRFAPTRVFLGCCLLAALANALTVVLDGQYTLLLVLRFAVGFLLAGIYPVGMKIAASWYRQGLGAAMGVLIGALVLGTALPHGLRALGADALPGAVSAASAGWQAVMLAVSALAALGGLAMVLWVPERPRAAPAQRITPHALGVIWSDHRLRASVFGYFGHMWELYAFYVLLPFILMTRLSGAEVSAGAFWVIAAGFAGCAGGGLAALRWGSARVAALQLAASGTCALATPWMMQAPWPLFIAWLLLWGTTVSGDSPQLSTLTARNAPPEVVGSVLTFANCIGFAITAASIELFVALAQHWPLQQVLPGLALGPLLGLWLLSPLWRPAR